MSLNLIRKKQSGDEIWVKLKVAGKVSRSSLKLIPEIGNSDLYD